MSAFPRCECTTQCGTDPRLPSGQVLPCANRRAWLNRPIVTGAERVAKFPCKIILTFQRPLTDEELQAFHSKVADVMQ